MAGKVDRNVPIAGGLERGLRRAGVSIRGWPLCRPLREVQHRPGPVSPPQDCHHADPGHRDDVLWHRLPDGRRRQLLDSPVWGWMHRVVIVHPLGDAAVQHIWRAVPPGGQVNCPTAGADQEQGQGGERQG